MVRLASHPPLTSAVRRLRRWRLRKLGEIFFTPPWKGYVRFGGRRCEVQTVVSARPELLLRQPPRYVNKVRSSVMKCDVAVAYNGFKHTSTYQLVYVPTCFASCYIKGNSEHLHGKLTEIVNR